MPESQQPYDGCEWYHPHRYSLLPTLSFNSINYVEYSLASAPAFTRVSVPITGNACVSTTINVSVAKKTKKNTEV